MISLVTDASATLAWIFPSQATAGTNALFTQLQAGDQAVVPAHWPCEVANALVVGMRRKLTPRQQLDRLIPDLMAMDIEVEVSFPGRVFGPTLGLAEKHRLSVYDAAYLELAIRRGLPLATLDNALRTDAEGVALLC